MSNQNLLELKQAVRLATQYATHLSSAMGAQAPRAPPSRRNVAVLSHAEYVPTLTAGLEPPYTLRPR